MILVGDKSFKRALKRLIKKSTQLQDKIFEVLDLLADHPFTPSLKFHKLTGQLEGLWSCSVADDWRIISTLKQDEALGDNLIILIDIGTHDEVY